MIGLSTSSVFPEGTAVAFELASRLGYDGVELMVGTDAVSQDLTAVLALVQHYQVPVLSVHSPCLLVTQRVWGTDPWGKLERARSVAERLGADTVVVHPPFRWQRDYARDFVQGLRAMDNMTAVRFAVENMFPWRAVRDVGAYAPDWDVRSEDYTAITLDLSHTAVSGTDAVALVDDLEGRVHHVHLADGSGSARDEHLVPGRGSQPIAAVMERLGGARFAGHVIVEVSTRGAADRAAREGDLAEALDVARRLTS